MSRVRHRWLALGPLVLAGCGLLLDPIAPPQKTVTDAGAPDTDAGTIDPMPRPPCEGSTEGDPCTPPDSVIAGVCRGQVCVRATCGDGVMDPGEECDDGNDTPGDGCEPSCHLTCQGDAECNDTRSCNGLELCDPAAGCVPGVAMPDGAECNMVGACSSAMCVLPDCGDGELNDGEECDDGNGTSGDGCEPDCTHTCLLNGRDCPPMPCKVASCDLDTYRCVYHEADRDGDGSFTGQVEGGMACGGDDCDDSDAAVHPGAAEVCNLTDDDCDGATDEGVMPTTCYPDVDLDGFGDSSGGAVYSCGGCSTGQSEDFTDCDDVDPEAFPGQPAYFAIPTRGTMSFDYDCDGREEPRHPATVSRSGLCGPGCTSAWVLSIPPCGADGLLVRCTSMGPTLCSFNPAVTTVNDCR